MFVLEMAQKELECHYCDEIFWSREMRWRHHSEHKKNSDQMKESLQIIGCKHCSKSFPTARRLGTHVQVDHSDLPKNFACSTCGSTFLTDSARAAHQRRHKIDIMAADRDGLGFNCKFCPKGFDKFQKLSAHVRHVHYRQTGQKPPGFSEPFLG